MILLSFFKNLFILLSMTKLQYKSMPIQNGSLKQRMIRSWTIWIAYTKVAMYHVTWFVTCKSLQTFVAVSTESNSMKPKPIETFFPFFKCFFTCLWTKQNSDHREECVHIEGSQSMDQTSYPDTENSSLLHMFTKMLLQTLIGRFKVQVLHE